MVSPEVIERIREALPLVEFIGRDVALKRAGSIYKGLCPFHNELTLRLPSTEKNGTTVSGAEKG